MPGMPPLTAANLLANNSNNTSASPSQLRFRPPIVSYLLTEGPNEGPSEAHGEAQNEAHHGVVSTEQIEHYLVQEVEKLALGRQPPMPDMEKQALLTTCGDVLNYLRDSHQLLQMKHDLIQFYNLHIFPLASQLKRIRETKRRLDKIIQPVLSRLQRFRQDTNIWHGTGLHLEQAVHVKPVRRFADLQSSEQLDLLKRVCPDTLSRLDMSQMEAILADLQNPKIVDEALAGPYTMPYHSTQTNSQSSQSGQSGYATHATHTTHAHQARAHAQYLQICHPLYHEARLAGPKRLRVQRD